MMEKLKSRKLWALILGVVLAFLTLDTAEAFEKSSQLIMVYVAAQGAIDLGSALK